MAMVTKYFIAILIISLISKGYCQCPFQHISIQQSETGIAVQGKPVWNVAINNNNRCTISSLKLDCAGFRTVKRVDPSILSVSGFCACSLNDININTIRSGRAIQGKSEWNVTVINNCNCPQKLIKLSCNGFQTVENVNPSILSKVGDKCLLIGGNQLAKSASVKFSYAWDPPYIFWPSESTIVGC